MNNSRSSLKKPGNFVRETKEEVASVSETFKSGRRELIQSTLFLLGYAVLFYLPLVNMPAYVHTVAVLTDKLIGRRSILITAFIVALMFAIPMFILSKDNYFFLLAVLVLFGITVAVPLGVAPATLVEC